MVSTVFASIGKRLRSARTERGLTLAELAGQTRISLAQIGSYERGDRQIGIEELLILAKALDKPVTWFLGIPDELTADERDLLALYRASDAKTRKMAKIVLGYAAAQLEQINHELAVLAARYSRWNQAYEIGSITLDELMGHRSRIAAQTDELQRQRRRVKLFTA